MENAISRRGEDRTLTELVLDGFKFKEITVEAAKMLQGYPSLESLSCNQTGLKSLENFPPIDTLQRVDLCDNGMNASCGLHNLAVLKNLRVLLLSGNKFKAVEELEPLSAVKTLEVLELELNPIAETPGYRKICFDKFPNLLVIDDEDRTGNAVEVDDEDDDDEDDEDDDDDIDEENGQDANGKPIMSLKDFYEKDISDGDEGGEDYIPGDKDEDSDESEGVDEDADM